jgi:rhodanese-related sulfurtransferase
MGKLSSWRLLAMLVGFLAVVVGQITVADAAERIAVEKLNSMPADQVTILDVRSKGSWERSDEKIKGAIRENPYDVENWANKYSKDSSIVLYCS